LQSIQGQGVGKRRGWCKCSFIAEADDQKNPKPADPREAKCKAFGKGGSPGQYVTQSLQPICDACRNGSGNQTYDCAQSQQKPNLFGCDIPRVSK